MCKFYRDFGRCKYSDYCAYAHIDKEDITEIARSLRNKIDDLENKVIENEKLIVKYSEKIESLEIEIVEQPNKTEVFMKKLENKCDTLIKDTETEKETKYENLLTKIDTLERQLKETMKHNFLELNKKIETLALVQNNVTTEPSENVEDLPGTTFPNKPTGIKCDKCDFVAKTTSSLKAHKTKTHAPNLHRCSFCEKTFRKKDDFKHHVIEKHSSTKIPDTQTYKCNSCEFIARNYKSLEVHLGKAHTEIFECGLCENEFNNLECLEIHLKTCEIYQCRHCQKR